jgi:hypothetical protein
MTNANEYRAPGLEAPASRPSAPVSAPDPAVPPEAGTPDPAQETAVPPAKRSPAFLALSVLMSIGGMAAFIFLFVRDFNVYWLILSPIIIALYQFPAVVFYWLYKGGRVRRANPRTGPR